MRIWRVVPELASRAHQQNIVTVMMLRFAMPIKRTVVSNSLQGPGLMGSLLVGSSLPNQWLLALEIPLVQCSMHYPPSHFIMGKDGMKTSFRFCINYKWRPYTDCRSERLF
jgi:N6-L-threonylcarbamoyladenine synthase